MAASLAVLAAPAWTLAGENQPASADKPVIQERTQTQATARQTSQEQSDRAQEQRALDQKPNLTDDVKLRVETYTGNDYSK
jgi:hypothetical protein